MQPDHRRLQDIVDAADEVATYMQGKGLDAFVEDRLRQRAIERLLTVIGEAAKNLSDQTRASIAQPWREIIRFRDKGIHSYDSLSPTTLYRIATESVPALAAAVRGHLGKAKPAT